MKDFIGKVALVTGGGSGIGRAAALAFAREGARVVVADISEEGSTETSRLIEEAGGQSISVRTDASISAQVEALVAQTVETYGRLDCAFNNAGIEGAHGKKFHEYPEDAWDRVIATNLKGVWLCMTREITQMLRQGGGVIVNTSSIAGLVAGGGPAYSASKHGVVGLTKTAAVSYAASGIRVNAVCPGVIKTAMVDRIFSAVPGTEALWLASEPIGRFADPAEVAEAVVWLCSDAASFVTGVALPVDGGWVAR